MDKLYEKMLLALQNHDKETAVKLAMSALEDELVDIVTLYEDVLTPVLNSVVEEFRDEDTLIWQEHIRSEIVISIIENSYTYVLKERDKLGIINGEEVMLISPKYEDHIIGSKMAANIFTIAGYKTIFIGANAPWNAALKAIENKKPKYISLSFSNFYNTVAARKTIASIKEEFDYGIKFILAGYALRNDKNLYKEIGGDIYIESLRDIFSIGKDVSNK